MQGSAMEGKGNTSTTTGLSSYTVFGQAGQTGEINVQRHLGCSPLNQILHSNTQHPHSQPASQPHYTPPSQHWHSLSGLHRANANVNVNANANASANANYNANTNLPPPGQLIHERQAGL